DNVETRQAPCQELNATRESLKSYARLFGNTWWLVFNRTLLRVSIASAFRFHSSPQSYEI
ncbi:hypothetical protein WG66_004869, partial [Moniliophthora roreri]